MATEVHKVDNRRAKSEKDFFLFYPLQLLADNREHLRDVENLI
jgi:hypothetical protein